MYTAGRSRVSSVRDTRDTKACVASKKPPRVSVRDYNLYKVLFFGIFNLLKSWLLGQSNTKVKESEKIAEKMGFNPINFIIWLIVLIFVGFWVGFICASLYVIVHCLAACLEPLNVSIGYFEIVFLRKSFKFYKNK